MDGYSCKQNPDIFLHVETGPLNVINWKKELNQLLPMKPHMMLLV